MHSVLNTFFQAPVSGEEKKRRLQERIAGLSLLYNPLLASPSDISHCSGARREKAPLSVSPPSRADGRERLSRPFLSR